jgi:hypothetical protein
VDTNILEKSAAGNGGRMFFQNADIHVQDYIMSQLRKQQSGRKD